MSEAIFDFLSVNLSVGDRISPLSIPQQTEVPAMAFRRISDSPVITHDSAQTHPLYDGSRYVVSRYQFDCYDVTIGGAEALADELVLLTAGYKGLWGDVEIDRVDPDVRVDDWDEKPGLYRVVQDLLIGHRVAVSS